MISMRGAASGRRAGCFEYSTRVSPLPSPGRRRVESAMRLPILTTISKVKWTHPAWDPIFGRAPRRSRRCPRSGSGCRPGSWPGRRGEPGGDPMPNRRAAARAYIAAVDAAGIAALTASFVFGDRPGLVPLLVAVAAAVLSSPFRIPLPVMGNVSIAFTFVFATLLVLGIPAAAITAAVAGIAASLLRRGTRWPLNRIFFNALELAVSSTAAGCVFLLAGGTPGQLDLAQEWPAVLLSAGAFFVANSCLVAGAVSLTDEIPFFINWRTNFLWTGPAYLAGAFLGAALTLGVQTFGLLALGLSLPLLYVLYFSLRLYASRDRKST